MKPLVLVGIATLLLGGCAGTPRYSDGVIEGEGFHHVYFGSRVSEGGTVHLYIEGDGRPVINKTRVASDPTPASSIVLKWMLMDLAPSYYLGRPCYLGMAKKDACDSRWWTTERYSPTIIDSMVVAAKRLLAGRPVVLIGYSGGGTLAVAMASRLENVRGLVTVAGNLDVDGWTRHHGYTSLTTPGDIRMMLRNIDTLPQRHYIGGKDRNVIPALTMGLADVAAAGSVCVMPKWNHVCCWSMEWDKLVDLGRSSCESIGGTVYSPVMEEPGVSP